MELELSGKRVLELGAGSGLIGLSLARKGAMVTASDLNQWLSGNAESSLK
jgi:2-polyprenyl-3-methyl-5-hydroxy-6-metoxy-1,4-benzoquinol methylase